MKNVILLWIGVSFLVMKTSSQTITDLDGNTYNTITIGTQIWMKENLRTTHFSNGDIIPTTSLSIDNYNTSIYQWAYNEDVANVNIYGRLYTWYAAVDNRNVCPVGWHVPNDSDWVILSNFLGGDSVAGSKMKETGTAHWLSTDLTVDNSSAFTGLPGGFRGNPRGFNSIGKLAHFWSSTPIGSSTFARGSVVQLHSDNKALSASVAVANCGLSIRCLKSVTTKITSVFAEEKNKIRLFPNPTNGKITISVEGTELLNLSIYAVTGALIFQQQVTPETNLINLNFLPNGVYIIKLVGTDFSIQRKLVKE